jgi:predicted metal-dependent hydrolase
MNQEIELNNRKINYTLTRTWRARYLRITIRRNGEVAVTLPYLLPRKTAENFLKKKSDWILKKIDEIKNPKYENRLILLPRTTYKKHKDKAYEFVENLLEKYNQTYGFRYNRVSIKKQRSVWGSCSIRGNLNFNYKILFLPQNLAEYIIVHELCHLEQLNHSRKFWELVERTFPNHKELRKELRRI